MRKPFCMLLLIALVSIPVGAKDSLAADLAWFEGSWQGSYSGLGVGQVEHDMVFRAEPGRQYLTWASRRASEVATRLESGFLARAGQTVQWHAAGEDTMVWMSAKVAEGDVLTFSVNSLGNTAFNATTAVVERLDNDSFRWRSYQTPERSGEPLADIIYRRVDTIALIPVEAPVLAFEDEQGWLQTMIGTWEATYSMGETSVEEYVVYTPHYSGRFLTVSVVLTFGAIEDSGFGFIGYEPQTGRLRSHMAAGVGMVHVMSAIDQTERRTAMETQTIGGGLQGDMTITLEIIDSSTIRYTYEGQQIPGGELVVDYHKSHN